MCYNKCIKQCIALRIQNDRKRNNRKAACPLGAQPEGKTKDCKEPVRKLINKFHVSVIESGAQDVHQTIIISIAFLSNNTAIADSTCEAIGAFIEQSTDAEIVDLTVEQR